MFGAIWWLVFVVVSGPTLAKLSKLDAARGATVHVNSNSGLAEDGRIAKLREKGKWFLSKRDYASAAGYYIAVLQIIEGIGGKESGSMRRRCSLTLAECEIKVGNWHNALARCSEVIEESYLRTSSAPAAPTLSTARTSDSAQGESEEIASNADEKTASKDTVRTANEEHDELRLAVGKAYYRRGVSLDKLGLPHLALCDLRAAHANLPDDESILRKIVAIEASLKSRKSGAGGSAAATAPSDAEGRGVGANDAVGGKQVHDAQVSVSTDVEDQLRDIIEEAQSSYPRKRLTTKQIEALLAAPTAALEAPNAATSAGDDPMSDILGGLGPMLGAGKGGPGLGGIGDISKLLGAGMGAFPGGGGGGMAGISGLLPLLGLAGVDPATISVVGEILKAVTDVWLLFRRVFKRACELRHGFLLALTLIWIVVAVVMPSLPNPVK